MNIYFQFQESYADVTLSCDNKFYPVHKLVLSTCSEYFEEVFRRTECKHPFIVLKDVKHEELEALLNYMYLGEVNVLQTELAGLIKAAECLRIKGLAVPDEEPQPRPSRGRPSKENASAANKRQYQEVDQRPSDDDPRPHKRLSVDESRSPREPRSGRQSSPSPNGGSFTNASGEASPSRPKTKNREGHKESSQPPSSPSHIEVETSKRVVINGM